MALFSSPFTSHTKVTKTQLDQLVTDLNAFDMGSWTALSGFASGYSDHSGTSGYAAAYRIRSLDGRVEMRGSIQKNTGTFPSGTTALIASLPGSIVPAQTVELSQAMDNTTDVNGRISITAGGALNIVLEASRGDWISLDQIFYYVS